MGALDSRPRFPALRVNDCHSGEHPGPCGHKRHQREKRRVFPQLVEVLDLDLGPPLKTGYTALNANEEADKDR